MEEVSSSILTWTAAVNLLSFATNRRQPLDWGLGSPEEVSKVVPVVSLMLTGGAEVEHIIFRTGSDLASLARISAAMRSNSTVSSLVLDVLDDMIIRHEPKLVPTLAETIRKATSLKKLTVNRFSLTLNTLRALTELLGPRSDIEVSLLLERGINELTVHHTAELRKVPSLQKLYAKFIRVGPETLGAALKNDWRNLQSLTLMNAGMGAAGGMAITSIACGLRTLNLRMNQLGDSATAALVEVLLRSYSRAPGGRGVLRKLDLGSNDIRECGMMKIVQLIKANHKLMQIDLSYNSVGSVGAAFGESLRGCVTTLRKLRLLDCNLGTGALLAISRSLAGSYSLCVLNIGYSRLNESINAIVHDLLEGASSLEELDVRLSNIDGPRARELAEGIAKSRSLKSVILIGNRGVGKEIEYLLGSTRMLRLTDVDLSNCCIGDSGSEAVGGFIAASSHLRRLDVRLNEFHQKGAKAISMGVAQSRSIEGLALESNKMGDEGAECAAEWIIRKSGTMRRLNISRIGMSVVGAKAVAKAVMDVAGKTALKIIQVGEKGPTSVGVREVLANLRRSVAGSVNVY